MSFSRNFWCSSSDSSASFAIDAEETKCDEFRHFTKFKYVELKFLFFSFSTGIAAYPLGGHSALQVDHINKNRKSSEDSSMIMLCMFKDVHEQCDT